MAQSSTVRRCSWRGCTSAKGRTGTSICGRMGAAVVALEEQREPNLNNARVGPVLVAIGAVLSGRGLA
jgi:hypothetical protein